MFGRSLSRLDFAQVSGDRTAKRASSQHFAVVVSRAVTGDASRFAVVVSKKIAKGAVTRHLLKRRVKEVVRPWCVAGAPSVIIYAREGSASLSYAQINEELQKLLQPLMT